MRDGGAAYAERLDGAGVDVRHVHHRDMIHGFASMIDGIDRATAAIADVGADLQDGLSGG